MDTEGDGVRNGLNAAPEPLSDLEVVPDEPLPPAFGGTTTVAAPAIPSVRVPAAGVTPLSRSSSAFVRAASQRAVGSFTSRPLMTGASSGCRVTGAVSSNRIAVSTPTAVSREKGERPSHA